MVVLFVFAGGLLVWLFVFDGVGCLRVDCGGYWLRCCCGDCYAFVFYYLVLLLVLSCSFDLLFDCLLCCLWLLVWY